MAVKGDEWIVNTLKQDDFFGYINLYYRLRPTALLASISSTKIFFYGPPGPSASSSSAPTPCPLNCPPHLVFLSSSSGTKSRPST